MTQNQIDRLREYKRKAEELQRELRILDTELCIEAHKDIDNDSIKKNAQKVNAAYFLSLNLYSYLNDIIL